MVKIDDEFRPRSMVPGRTLIFSPADAILFVRRCKEEQVNVLGVDAFHLTKDSIQPDMGESIDLSLTQYVGQNCWTVAESFLTQRLNSGLYFEVVAEE